MQAPKIILQLAVCWRLCGTVTVMSPLDVQAGDHGRVADHEGTAYLSEHLRRIREVPLQKPSTLGDAKDQLQNALQTAWHIGSHFGHTWSDIGHQRIETNTPANARKMASDTATTRVVNPIDFGADPTGNNDSTDAMNKAMHALLDTTGLLDKNFSNSIRDIGGATLDLAGGQYLISEPLVIPPYVGNTGIKGGTLRASSRFPRNKWLVMIGAAEWKSCANDAWNQRSCNQLINLEDVLLDGSHVAEGCVRISFTMGANIGPSFFCTGFNDVGVYIIGGHEVLVDHAWLTKYYWTEVTKDQVRQSESVGIRLAGSDHVLSNVIVFNHAHIGIEVLGPCNLLQNVHVWNGGGTGIFVNRTLQRLVGCYLDGNELVSVDPSELVVENTLFLDTNAKLRSNKKMFLNGVRFRGNTYATTLPSAPYPSSIEIDSTFKYGDVDLADELSRNGMIPLKLTCATRTLYQKDSKSWVFDFSDVLLLPHIDDFHYSFISDIDSDSFVRHMAHKPNGREVVIETENITSGTVTVQVSQGRGIQFYPGL